MVQLYNQALLPVAILFISITCIHAENWFMGLDGFDYSKLKAANGDFISYQQIVGQTGAVVYTEPVTAHQGFFTSFIWSNFNCQPTSIARATDYYDGFNFYISETDPNTSMDYYRQGYMYLPNTVTIGYNSDLQNEFYVCYWDTPPLYSANISIPAPPPQAPFFRRYCKTFPSLSLPLNCNPFLKFQIQYIPSVGITVAMGLPPVTLLTFNIPRSFRPYYHYVGLSAFNTVRNSSLHQFSSWIWDSSSEITRYILADTGVIALGQASVDTSTRRIWLSNSQSGIGFVVLRDYSVQLSQSFTFNFKWTLLGNADQSVAEGFALFLTKPRRELETLAWATGGLGIHSRPNTTIIGFNSVLNEFYLCSWNVPLSGALRSFCPTFPSPLPPISLNRTIAFEVTYNQDLFEVYGNNELLFASKLVLDKSDSYTIGFAGSSGNSSVRQYISEWSKTTASPPTASNRLDVIDVKTFGGASVYRDTITMVNNGTGVAVYKTPLPARLGFTTSFQWKPANCTSDSGFTFFLTTTPPSDITVSSDNNNSAGYGTSLLSRLTSFSLNFTSSQFTAYFDSTLSTATTYTSLVNPTSIRCTDFIDVRIEYTNANLVRFYLMNQLVASINDTANTIINPSLYYFGLSGVEGTFTRWSATTAVLSNKRQFSYNFNDAVINTLGTASVVNATLQLTAADVLNSGIAYYPIPLYAHTGFTSSLTWSISNCDTTYNGADGFTLFLSKNRPLASDVYQSQGGMLGVGYVPNTVMIAYSATYNEFYVCNWTTPLGANFRSVCNTVVPSPMPKMNCATSNYGFDYLYDGRTFKLRVNGATAFQSELKIDPSPYFVGVSGATGGGYFKQTISNWVFDSAAV